MKSKYLQTLIALLLILGGSACSLPKGAPDDFTDRKETADYADPSGMFVLNEGNFSSAGGGSLLYIRADGEVEEQVFFRANGLHLGKVPQDMIIRDGIGYILTQEGREKTGLAPDQVAGRLVSFDLGTLKVRKTFEQELQELPPTTHLALCGDENYLLLTPESVSKYSLYRFTPLEKRPPVKMWGAQGIANLPMVQVGRVTFAAAGNKVLLFTKDDIQSAGHLFVGKGCTVTGLATDGESILWVATSGVDDRIIKVDARRMEVLESHRLPVPAGALVSTPRCSSIVAKGDTIYFCGNTPVLSRHVFGQDQTELFLDARAYVDYPNPIVYGGIGVNPTTGKVYISLIHSYAEYRKNTILEIDEDASSRTVRKYSNLTEFPAGFFFVPKPR